MKAPTLAKFVCFCLIAGLLGSDVSWFNPLRPEARAQYGVRSEPVEAQPSTETGTLPGNLALHVQASCRRPTLPDDVAALVAHLEERISELRRDVLDWHDAAFSEAIELAEKSLAIRVKHQVGWTNAIGEPSEWYEIGDARRVVEFLHRLQTLSAKDRQALRSLIDVPTELAQLRSAGKYSEAHRLARRQLDVCRKVLGEGHPETLTALSDYSSLLGTLKRSAEAEPYCGQAVEGRRRVLGEDHPDTLSSIGEYGFVLYSLGQAVEAEPYCRQAMEGYRCVLGEDHPSTLMAMNTYGLVLERLGRPVEAESYFWQALEGCRRVLGEDHPGTLMLIGNYGGVLARLGDAGKGARYELEALEGNRRVLGEDHPSTLQSVINYAFTLQSLGRISEAEPYFRQALEDRRRLLGEDHPDTLTAISCYGSLLSSLGRAAEAEPYHRQAMEGRQRVLGDDNPYTLNSFNSYGGALHALGRAAEAEQYFRLAMDGSRRVLGVNHPDTLTALNNYSLVLESLGRTGDAAEYYKQTLDGQRRVQGEDHPDTLATMHNYGRLLLELGRSFEAELYLWHAVEGRRRVLGEEHPHTLQSIIVYAAFLHSVGRTDDAEEHYRQALALAERLRTGGGGGAIERATFAGELGLPAVAAAYYSLLIEDQRFAEALSVAERGRSRAALDLISRDDTDLIAVARATGDPDAVARLESAIDAETAARTAVFSAEACLPELHEQRQVCREDHGLVAEERASKLAELDQLITQADARLKMLRRQLSEKTAALLAQIRHLFPAANPLDASAIQAGLASNELLLLFGWSDYFVAVLAVDRSGVTGWRLAKGEEEVARLGEGVTQLRKQLADRPIKSGPTEPAQLVATLLPELLRARLARRAHVIVIPDGPLSEIPFDVLLPQSAQNQTDIAYAPSATIYLDRKTRPPTERAAPAGRFVAVVLGDPQFAREAASEPEYPELGVLLTMVEQDSNAEDAGLRRGDVLLRYAERELATRDDLAAAIAAVSVQVERDERAVNKRNIPVEAWRGGELMHVTLAPGRIGVITSPAEPAQGLRSLAMLKQSVHARDAQSVAHGSAIDQVRLFGGALPPLPGSGREAKMIARLLESYGGKVSLLTGADATAPHLWRTVISDSPRYLHLATHALMGSVERPLDASLALTQPKKPTEHDIGFLRLEDLVAKWGGKLNSCDLVVLSACNTQVGMRRGDTVMSLPLGFFFAGARTVLASLWKVDDTATALLMVRFYENLLGVFDEQRSVPGRIYSPGEAMSKGNALREAKLWLRTLNATDVRALCQAHELPVPGLSVRGEPGPLGHAHETLRPFAHAYFWSSFILIGNPE